MAGEDPHTKKQALLGALTAVRGEILDRSRMVDPTWVRTPFIGRWSIMELLAHLSGWDLANIEAAEAIQAGRLPAFYAHYDRDWRSFNDILVQRHLQANFERMQSAVGDTHQQLFISLELIPPDIFYKDRGLRFKGYKVILSRLLTSEIEDEETHLEQIDTFMRKHS